MQNLYGLEGVSSQVACMRGRAKSDKKCTAPQGRAEGIEAARTGLSEIRLHVAYQCRSVACPGCRCEAKRVSSLERDV